MHLVSGSKLPAKLKIRTPPNFAGGLEGEEKRRFDDREQLSLIRQPGAETTSQDQLEAEAGGIYSDSIKVETHCSDHDASLASECPTKLAREQWQALVALHRTLPYDHYDFLMATQHPLATDELKALPARYCMPPRI